MDAGTKLVEIAGPASSLHVGGIKLVGVNADTLRKLLLTLVLVALLWMVRLGLRWLMRRVTAGRKDVQALFLSEQLASLITLALFLLVTISIWFDNPARLATGFGLISAGLAFALQKVITALAGYFVILRGRVFNVGDRISMGGVRGDVIALSYTRTTVMEMGQPPAVQMANPAMWVEARQFTGRIVTLTNDKIFSEPVYNYSRDFPYIWEEMSAPLRYGSDWKRAEEILLEVARRHTVSIAQLGSDALNALMQRYFLGRAAELEPRVYLRLTDNWLELTVRFLVQEHGIRELKDVMSREILALFDTAHIAIASSTFEVVGLPPVQVSGGPIAIKQERP